jgi:SAM-dependent methyltransferase
VTVRGRDVLCLASGGGQQSAAFGILGSNVTVLDITENMLRNDRLVAEHYGLDIRVEQGDMRDLSRFDDDSFDIVWQAFSINFIPSTKEVFDEATRVLRPGGYFRTMFHNPIVKGVGNEEWTGDSYPIRGPYLDGARITWNDDIWEFTDGQKRKKIVKGPQEFLHTLSTVINGLIARGHLMLGIYEHLNHEKDPEPGSWEHLKSWAPPWLTTWSQFRPDILPGE